MSTAILSARSVGSATVIEFAADTNLDAGAVESIRERLAEAVEHGGDGVVLDLKNVEFASSPAIGLLVTLRLKAARTQRRLLLAGLRENLAGVLEIMQMAQLFEIHPTVDDALVAVAEAG